MAAQPPADHPDFVQGQIAALRALVLAVAQTMPKEEFRETGLARLELLRTAALATAADDSYLEAIDEAEKWLRQVTG